MLDAAFPPSPDQWVTDMDAVGADGGFIYAWGPYTNYSATHVSVARASGKLVNPIIVPGNQPGSVEPMLDACRLYGFPDGATFFDFESGSLPSQEWWIGARDRTRARGYLAGRYGTFSVLNTYLVGDADWLALWLRTGFIGTPPPVPGGFVAQQFVNDVIINGSQYDVSVADPSFFTPAPTVPPLSPAGRRTDFMKFVIWNSAQQLFRIKNDGTLVQAVNDSAGRWAQFELGVGYVPGSLVVDAVSVPGQLQVYALNPDGSAAHFWQTAGTGTWHTETIPNA